MPLYRRYRDSCCHRTHTHLSSPPPYPCPSAGDVGTCELPLAVRKLTSKVTWLQFWGMHDFHPSWGHIFHNRIPCFVAGRVSVCGGGEGHM